jgi:hypothetical protein
MNKKNPTRMLSRRGIAVISAVVIVVILIIVVPLAVVFITEAVQSKPIPPTITTTPTPLPIIGFTLVDPIQFMCMCSTDTKNGRNGEGQLILEGGIIEPGLDSPADLAAYPAVFAAGHPYYSHANSARFNGNLQNYPNWEFYVESVAHPLFVVGDSGVLEVTDEFPPVLIDSSIELAGIVVRHGGVLFIKRGDQPIVLKVGFILVESSGLFQVGSAYKPSCRLGAPLESWSVGSRTLDIIISTPDTGYLHAGVVTSQYSYRIYQPGVTITDPPSFSNYTGTNGAWENMFGPRIIANGFNGNIHMAGFVPEDVNYLGTWSAQTADNQNYLGGAASDLLTYAAHPDNNITDVYPNTWCHLAGKDVYNPGDTSIQVDAVGKLSGWLPGYQVLITCKTEEFCNTTNIDGRCPLWFDHADPVERAANLSANTTTPVIKDMKDGVEIATIASVDHSTGVITLVNPLQFRHLNTRVTMTRASGAVKTITVNTRVHVGLLSRSIRIQPEINTSGQGSGMNRWYYDVRDQVPVGGVDPSDWIGPLGSVACNYDLGHTPNSSEITSQCFDPIYNSGPSVDQHCNGLKPVPDSQIRGHFFYGTSQVMSSNAIIGFQTMFRYGSSTWIDGVELYRAGIPGNAGTVGQYPLHFHMSGFAQSFVAYRPADATNTDLRNGVVANCSIHSSYNRFIVTHGAHENIMRNNVAFLCRGSGFFTEAGVEVNNTWEHCLASTCLPVQNDPYYNPCYLPNTNTYDGSQFIIPVVSSDLLFPSLWWFKSNQNRCLRNVGTNCPSPVIGIWYTATFTANLRDIPNVVLGDPVRKLPALGDVINAFSNLNQFKTGTSNNPPCYSTSELQNALLSDRFGCTIFALQANSSVPMLCQAENVFYNACGATSTFPDFAFSPYVTGQTPTLAPLINHAGVPSFMPINAQNGCCDNQALAQANYFEHLWGAGTVSGGYSATNMSYPYLPLTQAEVKAFDVQGYTTSLDSKSTTLPMPMSGILTFNLSGLDGQLFAGPAWNKSSCTILINSCLLDHGGGSTFAGTPSGDANRVATSSVWMTMCGNAVNKFPNIYHVFHNNIVDGGLAIPPNPTVFSGSQTFFSSRVTANMCEYADLANVAVLRFWLGPGLKKSIFPPNFFSRRPNFPAHGPNPIPAKIYEMDTNMVYACTFGQSEPTTGTNFTKSQTRKYPFMCDNATLFVDRVSDFMDSNPRFGNIVVNTQWGLFLNGPAIQTGDDICYSLYSIIPNDV